MPTYVTTKNGLRIKLKYGLVTQNQYKQLVSNQKKMIKNLENQLEAKKSLYELHKAMTQGTIYHPHHGQYRFEINNLQRRLNELKNVLK